jgi:hypothetical protein
VLPLLFVQSKLLLIGKRRRNIEILLIDFIRLVQRHDNDKLIRTEFIILLCPDERLNQQIQTFTAEASRYLGKETSLKDRQHLRAFKLSSFFYVISFLNNSRIIFLFLIRYLIDMFIYYIKYLIQLLDNIIV